MSSSSSLAGARRRRAGGGSGPTSTSISANTASIPQRTPAGLKSSASIPTTEFNNNPFQLIQQHEIKLNILRETLQDIMSNKNNTTTDSKEMTDKINIDVEQISNFVMERVEKELDFKAFYENDEKLMNEIESLKNILQSQQMVINGLSTALYSVVSKLNLALPNLEAAELNVSEDTSKNILEKYDGLTSDVENTPTFPKSVSIVEGENTTMEFEPMDGNDDDDDDDDYITEQPSVD